MLKLEIQKKLIANKNQKIHLMQYVATLTVSNLLQKLAIHSNIKWPNDVLIGGKKVAGVLAQSFTNVSNVNEDTIGICLGIGLNVNCSQKGSFTVLIGILKQPDFVK